MSDYRIADGHDIALVSLTVIVPQPQSRGVQVADRSYAATGRFSEQGFFINLIWNVQPHTTAFQDLLTLFGLLNADTNEVTLYAPNRVWTYTRFNGLAVRPAPGSDFDHSRFRFRDISILVRDLVTSA